MKVDLGIWGKLTWAVTLLAIVTGLMLVVGWYLPLIRENQRMRQQIMRLSAQIAQEDDAGKHLRRQIDALQHDPKTVERLVRENLGYAKSNEVVIHFEDNTTAR